MSTLNEQLAHLSREHKVICEEGPFRVWSVYCLAGCIERDPKHPNYGFGWCKAAPGGEEQAARIAIEHLSQLGFVPRIHPTLDARIPRGQV